VNFNWLPHPACERVQGRLGDHRLALHEEESTNMDMNWAKRWLSLFKADTLDKMMEFYADSFDHVDVAVGHRSTNRKDLLAFYAAFMKGGSENEFVPTAFYGTADSGAVEWTWRVRHHGHAFGVDVEGKDTVLNGTSVIQTRDGLIVRQYDYWDLSTMLRQLGFALPKFE
jgi:steroid delta-isomerase-like uncharacterized protein